MARAANLIVALSARNGLCVAGGSPFRKAYRHCWQHKSSLLIQKL